MTVGANSLTDRATTPARAGRRSWTTPASDLRVLTDALGRLGYDADALARAAGLHEVDLSDPDAQVPCETYGLVLARAQQTRFTPNLALQLARVTPMGAYPLLDYVVLTSDTVGAGVGQLARYFRLVGNPVVLDVHDREVPIRIEMTGDPSPFSVEYAASLMLIHLRAETEGRFAAASLSLVHLPDDVAMFERALGCRVDAQAPWNGLVITPAAWQLPLRRRDPVLRRVLESRADEILARLPARTGVAHELQRALAGRVAGGDTRMATLARQLGLSGRTLQRRLATEGLSYHAVLDDVRKEAAGRYISGSDLAIGEVAYLVGYSEPAPFHRAFKRWFGVTPDAFRRLERDRRAIAINGRGRPS